MKMTKVKKGHVLVLRTNDKKNRAYGNFQYPKKGWVEAPDWKATEACGKGLHGALKGCGDGSLFNWAVDALWMVLEVEEKGIIDLGGKVKFKGGNVVYVGDRKTATDIIASVYGHIGIIGATVTGGYRATVTGGYRATVTGGDYATVTGGYCATVTGGNYAILSIKYWDGCRYRIATAYVGEDGIEANVAYRLNSKNKFVKVK